MEIIDLRSDTVTLPSQAMRDAIHRAELGDDVFGEDPITNRLQETAAQKVGKEAALLVASGTMANLTCLLTHCRRGDEVILGSESHVFYYEAGGMSALGGIFPQTVPNQPDGTLRIEDIEGAIRSDNVHYPRTRLISLENTHNRCSGMPLSVGYTASVVDLAHRHGLRVHLDGARVFNAAAALGVPVTDLTRGVDSVSFCLSKGLSAPIGSLICASREFIDEARRVRKMLGGGMRQTGVIAAAGIVALDEMLERLSEDHANARMLAEGIAGIAGLAVDLDYVKTNIVLFALCDTRISETRFLAELEKKGVKLMSRGNSLFRAVTHYGITKKDIERALAVMRKIMGGK
ncbi:MAG: low-specificity L-threonine aldolase [Deltaproteobacteria bacterium]|nr:low-specificity L-threonine aldolase [Deltaproteobacteria bacterium]